MPCRWEGINTAQMPLTWPPQWPWGSIPVPSRQGAIGLLGSQGWQGEDSPQLTAWRRSLQPPHPEVYADRGYEGPGQEGPIFELDQETGFADT